MADENLVRWLESLLRVRIRELLGEIRPKPPVLGGVGVADGPTFPSQPGATLTCTPRSDSAPDGWGTPFSGGGYVDPLGTPGGPNPEVILEDSSGWTVRRADNYLSADFTAGILYGQVDWENADGTEVITWQGPHSRYFGAGGNTSTGSQIINEFMDIPLDLSGDPWIDTQNPIDTSKAVVVTPWGASSPVYVEGVDYNVGPNGLQILESGSMNYSDDAWVDYWTLPSNVYRNGIAAVEVTNGYVIGACLHTFGDGTHFIIVRRQGTTEYVDKYDLDGTLDTAAIGSRTVPGGEYENQHPYFFNASGNEAQAVKNDGVKSYRVKITISGSTATFTDFDDQADDKRYVQNILSGTTASWTYTIDADHHRADAIVAVDYKGDTEVVCYERAHYHYATNTPGFIDSDTVYTGTEHINDLLIAGQPEGAWPPTAPETRYAASPPSFALSGSFSEIAETTKALYLLLPFGNLPVEDRMIEGEYTKKTETETTSQNLTYLTGWDVYYSGQPDQVRRFGPAQVTESASFSLDFESWAIDSPTEGCLLYLDLRHDIFSIIQERTTVHSQQSSNFSYTDQDFDDVITNGLRNWNPNESTSYTTSKHYRMILYACGTLQRSGKKFSVAETTTHPPIGQAPRFGIGKTDIFGVYQITGDPTVHDKYGNTINTQALPTDQPDEDTTSTLNRFYTLSWQSYTTWAARHTDWEIYEGKWGSWGSWVENAVGNCLVSQPWIDGAENIVYYNFFSGGDLDTLTGAVGTNPRYWPASKIPT